MFTRPARILHAFCLAALFALAAGALSGCNEVVSTAEAEGTKRLGEVPVFRGVATVIYRVDDLEAARAWYEEVLGVAPYHEGAQQTTFNLGGFELVLDAASPDLEAGGPGTMAYWGVGDAEVQLDRLLAMGATLHRGLANGGGAIRTASVRDPFGNVFGLIESPAFASIES